MAPAWVGRAVDIVSERLPTTGTRRVAVVRRSGQPRVEDALRERLPDAVVTVHDTPADAERLHASLAAAGPFDLVLDVADGARVADRFPRLLFHLRRGGDLVSRRQDGTDDPLAPFVQELLAAVDAGTVRAPTEPRDPRPRKQADFDALASSVEDVEIRPRFVIARLGVETLAKLPEHLMADYLASAPDAGRVLASVPGGRWRSLAEVSGSDPDRVRELPDAFEGPELALRSYDDVVCLPHSGVLRGNVVLPDTYRRRQRQRMRSAAVVDWAHWFARRPGVTPRRLPGTYFHLDNEWRGHFGHALTEQAAKLWAWRRAEAQAPGVRGLLFSRPEAPVAAWEYDFLSAAGIPPDRVAVLDEPVEVETLLTATPAYALPDVLHPVLGETYAELGAALGEKAGPGPWPDRVFLSRRQTLQRSCHNAGVVEDLMRQHGFCVVYPEDHPLAVQAQLVRQASVVAGFSGSGMYQIALTDQPKHVIAIGSESYTATVELKLCALRGHRLDLVWCQADVPLGSSFSREAFKADFTFDPDREGRYLRGVLDELTKGRSG
ncbi:MAG: glycosyltransferase family 61 protein [Actinomycetota bacterium]|nr:glycosyltransferase family 61 protein [Actinomycetota bacterium]